MEDKLQQHHFFRSSEPRDMTKCFIIMPIKKGFDEVYKHVIKPMLDELGIKAIRADEIYSQNPIIEDIWNQIQSAGWIVADLTGKNPNVLYELGLAHGIDRDVILLTQDIDDIPFDLQHWRCIEYKQNIEGGQNLKENLKRVLIEDSSYVHVPLILLTERFKDAFRVLETRTVVGLSGINGSSAIFSEVWKLTPIRSASMTEFIRKIQTSGALVDISCDSCETQMRKFMEGVFLVNITPPAPAVSGDIVNYRLNYKIHNGFAAGGEFWNFDFDCPTENFVFIFEFNAECIPNQFSAVKHSSGKNIPISYKKDCSDGVYRYEITAQNVPSGDSLTFKWKWQ